VAAAAAAAVGVSKQEGRAWLEAARDGSLGTLKALLASNPLLLDYQVMAIYGPLSFYFISFCLGIPWILLGRSSLLEIPYSSYSSGHSYSSAWAFLSFCLDIS